jgi:hypothetical protein
MLTGDLVSQYLGDSPAAAIVAGFCILIVINLVLAIVLAHKSKTDNINFTLLPDFIQPLLLYTVFIVAMEAMMIIAKGIPFIQTIFYGIEMLGVAAVAMKYLKQIYDKLKKLGMPVDTVMDKVIEDKLNSCLSEIAGRTPVIEEQNITTLDPPSEEEVYIPGRMDEESER